MNWKQEDILAFGKPQIEELNKDSIKIIMDDDQISYEENIEQEAKYKFEDGNVKFCLYNTETEKRIFTMDFFFSPCGNGLRYGSSNEKWLTLELLLVHDRSMQRKGIGSYYIKKLKQFALKYGYDGINVALGPNADVIGIESRGITKDELIQFYERLSTRDMPIRVI